VRKKNAQTRNNHIEKQALASSQAGLILKMKAMPSSKRYLRNTKISTRLNNIGNLETAVRPTEESHVKFVESLRKCI